MSPPLLYGWGRPLHHFHSSLSNREEGTHDKEKGRKERSPHNPPFAISGPSWLSSSGGNGEAEKNETARERGGADTAKSPNHPLLSPHTTNTKGWRRGERTTLKERCFVFVAIAVANTHTTSHFQSDTPRRCVPGFRLRSLFTAGRSPPPLSKSLSSPSVPSVANS